MGSIPGLGRSAGGGNGNLLQYLCLGNPMDRELGSLQSMVSQRVRPNDVGTEHAHSQQGAQQNPGPRSLTLESVFVISTLWSAWPRLGSSARQKSITEAFNTIAQYASYAPHAPQVKADGLTVSHTWPARSICTSTGNTLSSRTRLCIPCRIQLASDSRCSLLSARRTVQFSHSVVSDSLRLHGLQQKTYRGICKICAHPSHISLVSLPLRGESSCFAYNYLCASLFPFLLNHKKTVLLSVSFPQDLLQSLTLVNFSCPKS